MVARTLPNLGLTAYWPLGDDSWKDGMDANLFALSILGQLVADEFATGLPAGVEGKVVITNGSDQIGVYESGAWRYISAREGWRAWVKAENALYVFDGTDTWNPVTTGSEGSGLPPGGAGGQVLAKASVADGDVEWIDPPEGGGGGGTGTLSEAPDYSGFTTTVNMTSGGSGAAVVQALAGRGLHITFPSWGGNSQRMLLKSAPVGDFTFTARLKVQSYVAYNRAGVILRNAVGRNVMGSQFGYTGSSAAIITGFNADSNINSDLAGGVGQNRGFIYWRVTWTAATHYMRFEISEDGLIWRTHLYDDTWMATGVTHYGFACAHDSTGDDIGLLVDYFEDNGVVVWDNRDRYVPA